MRCDDSLDLSASGERRRTETEFDEVVAEYVDRLNAGETVNPLEILSDHPQVGKQILDQLKAFIDLDSGAPSSSPLGTLGDYTLRRQIGRGGMGVVYEAWEGSMDRVVALKVLPPGVAADNKALTRFMREAKTAGQLRHENIVGVYSTGVKEGTPWYSMEYVEGETLAQILARIKDAEPETETSFGRKDDARYFMNFAEAFANVADGLQHAHSRGVVHRDIKPSNLILEPGGKLRILDFGLARLEGQESLTLSGDLMGTVLYMSPEQAMAKRIQLDHRTDVYSLGATLYEVLTGQPPFKGKDQHDTLSQIIGRDPRPPRQLNPRIPQDLETIVLKCLRKDPGHRYGTAEALAQDLGRFARGDPIEARPEAGVEKLARGLWRHRRLVLGMGAGAIVVLIALVVSNVLIARARDRAMYDLYVSDVHLANEDWERGNLLRFNELLERHVAENDLRGWEWYYLSSLRAHGISRIDAGDAGLRTAHWSPDDRFIATGDARGEVKVWNAGTGDAAVTFPGQSTVNAVAWSPDSLHLAVAYEDGSIRLRRVSPGTEIPAPDLRHDTGRASSVVFSPDGRWLASGGRESVKIWKWGTEIVKELPFGSGHGDGCVSLAWSPDSERLAAGLRSRPTVQVWEVGSWTSIRFRVHDNTRLSCLAWSRSGDLLASAGRDEKIRIWNTATWKEIPSLAFDSQGPAYSLAWEPEPRDARLLIGGAALVRIRHLASGDEVTRRGHAGRVWSVSWSADGSRVASAGEDGMVRIWQPEGEQRSRRLQGETPVAYSPCGLWFAMESNDEAGTVSVMDSSTETSVQSLRCEMAVRDTPISVSFSPDSRRLAVGTRVGTVHIWNWPEAEKTQLIEEGTPVSSVSWKPDGSQLAIGLHRSDGVIWDLTTGQEATRLQGECLAWSPDEELLAATIRRDDVIRILDARTWEEIHLLRPQRSFGSPNKFQNALAWSPDGRRLASGNSDGSVQVWDPATGELLGAAHGHSGDVMSVAWHCDGTRLVSGSEDRTIKIWDMETYRELLSIKDDGRVTTLAWHPDGTRLLTAGGRPNSVRIWDARPAYAKQ